MAFSSRMSRELCSTLLRRSLTLLVAALFLFFPTVVVADTRYSHINNSVNGSYLYIDFFRYGGGTGVGGNLVELKVSNISFSKNPRNLTNLSQISFFLVPNWRRNAVEIEMSSSCTSRRWNSTKIPLYTFDKLLLADSFHVALSDIEPGSYSLNYENCLHEQHLNVSMVVRSSMYTDLGGGRRSYLSQSKFSVSGFDYFFLTIYLSLAMFWIHILFFKYGPASVNRIHLLMLIVLLLKAISLICDQYYLSYISTTGCAQCWPPVVLMFISRFLSSAPGRTLLVLIGTGWCNLKPYLLFKEKILVMTVPLVHVIMNVLTVFVDQSGPNKLACGICSEPLLRGRRAEIVMNVFLYADMYHLLPLLIVVALSTKFLRECASAHGKASSSLFSFFVYRQFLSMVVSYQIFNACVLMMVETLANQYIWPTLLLKELATLVFYMSIGNKFKPEKRKYKLYGVDDDVEEDAYAVLMLRSDCFMPLLSVFSC